MHYGICAKSLLILWNTTYCNGDNGEIYNGLNQAYNPNVRLIIKWDFYEMGPWSNSEFDFFFLIVIQYIWPYPAGVRTNCSSTDLSEILPEELEEQVKSAAEISMGTEVSDEDIDNIKYLCDQVCVYWWYFMYRSRWVRALNSTKIKKQLQHLGVGINFSHWIVQ